MSSVGNTGNTGNTGVSSKTGEHYVRCHPSVMCTLTHYEFMTIWDRCARSNNPWCRSAMGSDKWLGRRMARLIIEDFPFPCQDMVATFGLNGADNRNIRRYNIQSRQDNEVLLAGQSEYVSDLSLRVDMSYTDIQELVEVLDDYGAGHISYWEGGSVQVNIGDLHKRFEGYLREMETKMAVATEALAKHGSGGSSKPDGPGNPVQSDYWPQPGPAQSGHETEPDW